MKEKVLFNRQNLCLHEQFGTNIVDGSKRYMFLPMWIEINNDKLMNEDSLLIGQMHSLGELPEELKKLINDFKNDPTK